MEKAEAIEVIRKNYPHVGSSGNEFETALRELIPELKESEDEKIRKRIVEILDSLPGSYWYGQKEKDDSLAYLEKQKENPKSADSIPSDCVSDAKCGDRWHKVADSLPDNPREVLCKDEAGNYFIGRYYVGEGWDISNYDDENKPHHLNPPVSKWIDFPSEKQKEQKPAEWSEEDSKRYVSIGTTLETSAVLSKEDYDANMVWLRDLVNAKKYSGPTPSWKPSEEQMEALNALNLYGDLSYVGQQKQLISLYQDLKKLM